ncbi:MAG: hypothetical protein ACO26U_05155 [Burkholderiaceae bacterium]
MDEYDPKLVHLPGTKLTPEVVLHRTLNKLDRIKSVAVVIQWDDNTLSIDWSQMKVSELCMAAMLMDTEARAVLEGRNG